MRKAFKAGIQEHIAITNRTVINPESGPLMIRFNEHDEDYVEVFIKQNLIVNRDVWITAVSDTYANITTTYVE